MVKKYPPSLDDLKGRREHVPASEIKFYNIVDALNDDWYVWHSIRWDNDAKSQSGEADYLVFNPEYGFIVIEVKGGSISVEDNNFFTTNLKTGEKFRLDKDPFHQAEQSMHYIRDFYIQRANLTPNSEELLKSNKYFPLSFGYAVFFPDCNFKREFEYLQYSFNKIFDESDLISQYNWEKSEKSVSSPLEQFLIALLDQYRQFRTFKPKVAEFFPKLVGSNITRYVTLKKYYSVREQELIEINQVQDFLIDALSEKPRCIFKGSAGSGKTFLAMKKAIKSYEEGKKTLFLCFNVELKDSIQKYLSSQIGESGNDPCLLIEIYSLHSFLKKLVKMLTDTDSQNSLMSELSKFKYKDIAEMIRNKSDAIPSSLKYDVVLIDEAQDIDNSLWDVFSHFLRDPNNSLFYVFYDEAQSLFIKDFSPIKFGMDEKSDLIVLNRNLRNTVEIAMWLKYKTTYGNYKGFSGINGFKITSHKFPSAKETLIKTMSTIQKKYHNEGINPERIAILSYYKLKTLIPQANSIELCDFLALTDKTSGRKIFLVEPSSISSMEEIKSERHLNSKWCTVFKTITSFKGLESDILFLIVPNIEEFKNQYPNKYDNFLMQVYVGASRAKFKLYVFEYNM